MGPPPKSKGRQAHDRDPAELVEAMRVHLAEHTVLDLDVGPKGPCDASVREPRRPLHPHVSDAAALPIDPR